jgi:hypothetical protein
LASRLTFEMPPRESEQNDAVVSCACDLCGHVNRISTSADFDRWNEVCATCGHPFEVQVDERTKNRLRAQVHRCVECGGIETGYFTRVSNGMGQGSGTDAVWNGLPKLGNLYQLDYHGRAHRHSSRFRPDSGWSALCFYAKQTAGYANMVRRHYQARSAIGKCAVCGGEPTSRWIFWKGRHCEQHSEADEAALIIEGLQQELQSEVESWWSA